MDLTPRLTWVEIPVAHGELAPSDSPSLHEHRGHEWQVQRSAALATVQPPSAARAQAVLSSGPCVPFHAQYQGVRVPSPVYARGLALLSISRLRDGLPAI